MHRIAILEYTLTEKQQIGIIISSIFYFALFVSALIYWLIVGRVNGKVIKSSEFIKKIDALNDEYNISDYKRTFKYYEHFDDLRNFRHFNPDKYLATMLMDNSSTFKYLVETENNMINTYERYLKKYESLKSNSSEEDAKKLNINFAKYKKVEDYYFKRHKLEYTFKVKFIIYWDLYNTVRKDKAKKVYTFDEAKKIFIYGYNNK